MAGTMVSEGVIYPFDHFNNKAPFVALAAKQIFSMVSVLLSSKTHACIAQLSAIDSAGVTYATTTKWAKDFGVICMTPGNMFFHAEELWGTSKG